MQRKTRNKSVELLLHGQAEPITLTDTATESPATNAWDCAKNYQHLKYTQNDVEVIIPFNSVIYIKLLTNSVTSVDVNDPHCNK